MNNIYDGSILCKTDIFSFNKEEFIRRLNKVISGIKDPYVVVDISDGVTYSAKIVIYENAIPKEMLNYKYRWILKDNQWIRLCLLGICDVCKQEKELVCLCDKGHICCDCNSEINFR